MPTPKKRAYNSESRKAQSQQTKNRILASAKMLFESKGFDQTTIEEIAQEANVSAPSIYSLFQSKRGILLGLIDEALPSAQFEALVDQGKREKCPHKRLELTAKLARQIYDAEKAQSSFLRGASLLDPVFKGLEIERERRRYQRQEEFIKELAKDKSFTKNLSLTKARDMFWALTGRDLYRMFVTERGWSSDDYEKWLSEHLIRTFLNLS